MWIKKLFIAFGLGIGCVLGTIVVLTWNSHLAYAVGSRYVAPPPLGNDISNDCLSSLTPCATIQYAVDQANPDDEIRVAAGTYTGIFTRTSILFPPSVVTQVVYITKPLAIRGGYTTTNWSVSNPVSNLTVVDAEGQGRVFNIENNTTLTAISVTVEGFSITNGNGVGQVGCWGGGQGAGGGINGCSVTATLVNNYIFNNSSGHVGGGIALIVENAPLTLINNQITTNTVTAYNNIGAGGGIALGIAGGQYNAVLESNLVRNNRVIADGPGQSAWGGGFFEIGNVLMKGNVIQANEVQALNGAKARGGGVDIEGSLAMITNTVIADNRIVGSGDGAGIFLFSKANLWHVTIARNSGGDNTGIHLLTSTLTMTNSIVVSHTVGLTVSASSTATLKNVLWFNNTTTNITGAGKIELYNQFTGDPIFIADGYHLGTGSAALGRGINAGVVSDIDGEFRSLVAPDLGVDEVVEPASFLPVVLKN